MRNEYEYDINQEQATILYDGKEIDVVDLCGLVENWIDDNKEMLDGFVAKQEN